MYILNIFLGWFNHSDIIIYPAKKTILIFEKATFDETSLAYSNLHRAAIEIFLSFVACKLHLPRPTYLRFLIKKYSVPRNEKQWYSSKLQLKRILGK